MAKHRMWIGNPGVNQFQAYICLNTLAGRGWKHFIAHFQLVWIWAVIVIHAECFRGELFSMGHYTNLSTFTFSLVTLLLLPQTTVAWVKCLATCVSLSVILSVCPHDYSKTSDLKVFKLGKYNIGNELGISYGFGVERSRSQGVQIHDIESDRVAGVN